MMMQILKAGGMDVLTDAQREADADNPKGYYEFEQVKKLKEGDLSWAPQARGKVVKIISALLEYLPAEFEYKIIFMQRDMQEILASQKQMLIRRGEPTDRVDDETLGKLFEAHLTKVHHWLASQKNVDVLFVPYASLLGESETQIHKLNRFLGLPLNTQAMLKIPDPELHRQRNG